MILRGFFTMKVIIKIGGMAWDAGRFFSFLYFKNLGLLQVLEDLFNAFFDRMLGGF